MAIRNIFKRDGLSFKKSNKFLFDNLKDIEKEFLTLEHSNKLNELFFFRMIPKHYNSLLSSIGVSPDNESDIISATCNLNLNGYSYMNNIDFNNITKEQNNNLLCFYHHVNDLVLGKNKETDAVDKLLIKDSYDDAAEAFTTLMSQNKILNTLDAAKGVYADLLKLEDKYSIRLGDGKYAVASDEVAVTMRDPSDNPGWAIWFLQAVPISMAPNVAQLYFLPENERKKLYPKPIDDNFIICHASLWDMGNTSAVLLHTSWNHIAASYRWHVDKPIEVASILFKSVSHPCHIARNFGYSPQIAVPSKGFFKMS